MLISSRQGLMCSPARQPRLPVDPNFLPRQKHMAVLGALHMIYTGLRSRRGGACGPLPYFNACLERDVPWGRFECIPPPNLGLCWGFSSWPSWWLTGGGLGLVRALVQSAQRRPRWTLPAAPFLPKYSFHTCVQGNRLTLNGCNSRSLSWLLITS